MIFLSARQRCALSCLPQQMDCDPFPVRRHDQVEWKASITMSSIALQLYTVRQALADDPEQTLRRVKAAGYAEVEAAPPSPELNADALAGMLRSVDLRVVAAHADLPLGKRRACTG